MGLDDVGVALPGKVVKVLQQFEVGDHFGRMVHQGKTSMQVEAARKILAFARAGLPIIVVGAPPDQTPGLRPGSDAELQKIIRELLAEPCVYQVTHESDVPGKLKSLGIHPAAEPASPSSLLSVHRSDSSTRTNYYFLYNEGVVSPKGEPANLFEPATGTPLDVVVTLEGKGNPYLMDAWSGRITPIANYSSNAGHVTIRVKLSPDDAELIALSEDTQRFGIRAPKIHVTTTSADGAVTERNAILIRSTKVGTISTTLSNGESVSTKIAGIPGAIALTHAEWALSVEDWQPANPYDNTGARRRSHKEVEVDHGSRGIEAMAGDSRPEKLFWGRHVHRAG